LESSGILALTTLIQGYGTPLKGCLTSQEESSFTLENTRQIKAAHPQAAIVNSKVLGVKTLDTSSRSSSIDGHESAETS
jgi:hypothetical protein